MFGATSSRLASSGKLEIYNMIKNVLQEAKTILGVHIFKFTLSVISLLLKF